MITLLTDCSYIPTLHEDSSCGSVVLGALLGVCTQEADMLMDLHSVKGWNGYTNINHIRNVVKERGINMSNIPAKFGFGSEEGFKVPTALFIQLEGPWEDKGWRSAYNHTHWALGFQGFIIDYNSIHHSELGKLEWRSAVYWSMGIMERVVKSVEDCTGWHIRSAYQFEEVK